jgi:hypothetical protein
MRAKKIHVPLIAATTVFFVVALSAAAVADNVSNNLDGTVDVVAEVMSLNTSGADATTRLYVDPTNGDGKNGCNLTGGTTLVVSVASSDTSVATVSPSSVTFTSCVTSLTGPILTVSPHNAGSASISLSLTSNGTAGSFNLAPGTFMVNVAPPPNTAPSILVTGVTGGANYEFGSVPTAGCYVTDAEDGHPSVAPSLSAIGGPMGQYGLGSQTASCTYTDAGGLPASASVKYNIVDTTKPMLNLPAGIIEEAASASGTNVAFSVSATDGVDPSPTVVCSATSGALFPIGTTTVDCTATDVAGNVRSGSFDVMVADTTDPVVTISSSAVAGPQGWYNIDSSGTDGIIVTVSATDAVGVESLGCDDSGSAIADVHASGDTFTLVDGKHHITCTALDAAANDGSDSKSFEVDQTAPTITPSYSAVANGAGWNNTDVTVSYACDDDTSGIDPAYGCPNDDVLTTNGLFALHKATADHAGNVVQPDFTVRIDKDAPTISGSASPAPIDGWNNVDVTVAFSCLDVGPSGIKSCTAPSPLTEGGNQNVVGTGVDNADNTVSTTVGPINIDETDPVITVASRTHANDEGWNAGPVEVTFACDDGSEADDSGVASLTAPQTVSTDGIHSVTGTCVDDAGNSASITVFDIKIDSQSPTILGNVTPGPNSNGWNDSDVAASFTCSDDPGGSGLQTNTVAGATLTSEGSGQSVTNTGVCVDHAGNAAHAVTVGGINIDKSAPLSIAFVGGGIADGGTYSFGFVPPGPSGCTADGAISGLDSCNLDGGYSTAIGQHTITATARDRAGNQATATISYAVNAWTLKGFFQPVDMPTLTTPYLYNAVKNGSTVPLKFQVFAGPTQLTNVGYIKPLTYAQTNCSGDAITDDIETLATGGTVLRYESTGGQFVYNWQTPKTAGKCYRVTLSANDGSSLTAYFKLK